LQLAIFGSASGADETAIALFGNATLDLTLQPILADTTLTIAAIFGGVKVIVPPGARVATRGLALFGESRVKVQPGDGPTITIRNLALFGDIKIVEGQGSVPPTTRTGERIFPY